MNAATWSCDSLMGRELLEALRDAGRGAVRRRRRARRGRVQAGAERAAAGEPGQQGRSLRAGHRDAAGAGMHGARARAGVQAEQPQRPRRRSAQRLRASRCTPIAARSPMSAATGCAIRSGCWTISRPRTAPSAWCRARTSGAGCRRTPEPTGAAPRRSTADGQGRHGGGHERAHVARGDSQPHGRASGAPCTPSTRAGTSRSSSIRRSC